MSSVNLRTVVAAAFLLGTTLVLRAPAAHAQQLWASSLASTSNRVVLSQINPATGADAPSFEIIGGGSGGALDIAGDPLWQGVTLWGVRRNLSASLLVAWNPIAKSFITALPISAPAVVSTLAIDPTNGRFYGTTSTNLYAIDPLTAQATLVGPTSGTNVNTALAFDALGRLYGVSAGSKLVSIDKTTGASTLVATLSIFNVEGLARRPDGVMLAIGYGPDYRLYELNLTTGATANLGDSLLRPSGLAFTGLRADFDLSGKVDAADLARLRSNFGALTGAAYAQGDANGDGAVNGDDLLVWQRQLGSTTIPPTANPVPEPAAAILAACGFAALMRRRRSD